MDKALLPFSKAVDEARKRLADNPKSNMAKVALVDAESTFALKRAVYRAFSGIRLS